MLASSAPRPSHSAQQQSSSGSFSGSFSGRNGASAYEENTQALTEAVKQIQQHCADIKRETSMLSSTAGSFNGRKSRVQDAKEAAKAAIEEAKRRLKAFP